VTLPIAASVAVNVQRVTASVPLAEAVHDTGVADALVIVAGVQLTVMLDVGPVTVIV
jgi:hypothetical protein